METSKIEIYRALCGFFPPLPLDAKWWCTLFTIFPHRQKTNHQLHLLQGAIQSLRRFHLRHFDEALPCRKPQCFRQGRFQVSLPNEQFVKENEIHFEKVRKTTNFHTSSNPFSMVTSSELPPRSRTSLAQGSFLGSTEGSLGNVRRRQRRPHWEAGGPNSRLWGRLIVNTHRFLVVQLSLYNYCEYHWYGCFQK